MLRYAALLLTGSALLGAAPAWADIEARQTEGVWQVSADGERLSEVLTAIQSEAGFRLVGADRLIDDNAVTVDLTGPLDDIIARLLQGFDYALVYGETPETEGQIQRLVLLSGRAGTAPDESQRAGPTRLSDETMTEEDGERVSALLQRQVQPLVDADNGVDTSAATQVAAMPSGSDSGNGNGNEGGGSGDDLDAETQAQLAEATQRAQRDLEALVRALREQENNQNDGN
ncbi:hypothetical protein [Hyphobacterium marinum]|uniref:Secretin/TonB short N-terminal domain-containing protein n=1 Tax=Hyphobacterium marinum TaxID=3116574 RepID=A0ABU7LVX0_9PROT|nr:hypothetical protein [Hyphobacterium sp. Y6023]MEE2565713.1 hypothetical protein [Hyphobacterium sp. Y6023]